MKLFVMPSQQVWYTGIALAGTCVLGAIIVSALHLYEKVRLHPKLFICPIAAA